MTVIEFFDDNSIENIVSSLLCHPQKVIFVGDNSKRIKRNIKLYEEILTKRNINIDFEYRTVNRNDLSNIVEVLTQIVENNEGCIFDLDGGEDLYLVAVGIIYNKYPSKSLLHRFNIRNNSLIDCDSDGIIVNTSPFEISVEENIRIYAGKIISDNTNSFTWDFNNEFIEDINLMWLICKDNLKAWNIFGTTLSTLEDDNKFSNINPLETKLNIKNNTSYQYALEKIDKSIISRLANINLIEVLQFNSNQVHIKYKNEQIKKCIVKAGQLLELYITLKLKELLDKNGNIIYNDIQTGVTINWEIYEDNNFYNNGIQTTNEIDIILMKGLIPVFISCKNGMVEMDELYKLSTVAEKFGGKYSKKVLIVSDLDYSNYNHEYISARAKDMNIHLIDNFTDLCESEIKKVLSSLWKN